MAWKQSEERVAARGSRVFALAAAVVLVAGGSAYAQVSHSVPETAARDKVQVPAPENFSTYGLVEEVKPDGSVQVDLQGRFKHYLVAHIGPDGKLHTSCSTKHPEIDHHHEGQTSATETEGSAKKKEAE